MCGMVLAGQVISHNHTTVSGAEREDGTSGFGKYSFVNNSDHIIKRLFIFQLMVVLVTVVWV